MRLTKIQRHTAYVLILYEIKRTGITYVCTAFDRLVGMELDADGMFTNLKLILPELWKKRDDDAGEWSLALWRSNADRIKALKDCISETY